MPGKKQGQCRIVAIIALEIAFVFWFGTILAKDKKPSPEKTEAAMEQTDERELWKPDPKDFKPGEEGAMIQKAIEKLSPGDAIRLKLERMDWQFQYYQSVIRQLELEYMARCYKDPRYINNSYWLEEVRRESRLLLLR